MSAAEAVRVPVPGVRLRIDDEQPAVFPFRFHLARGFWVFHNSLASTCFRLRILSLPTPVPGALEPKTKVSYSAKARLHGD